MGNRNAIVAHLTRLRPQFDWMREENREAEDPTEDFLLDRYSISYCGLLNITMRAPQPVYNGRLVQAQIRHFDLKRERPGLPKGVAAPVENMSHERGELTLLNVGKRDRKVTVQAGSYGEHVFENIECDGERRHEADREKNDGVDGTSEADALAVSLPSGTRVTIDA